MSKLFHTVKTLLGKEGSKKMRRDSLPIAPFATEDFVGFESVHYGLPYDSTVLSFDCVQGLLAVGTSRGVIKVFGRSFVERMLIPPIAAKMRSGVKSLLWAVGGAALVAVYIDSSCCIWDMRHLKVIPMHIEDTISCVCTMYPGIFCIFGTLLGEIRAFNITKCAIADFLLPSPGDGKGSYSGTVLDMTTFPGSDEFLLAVYERGGIVLWNIRQKRIFRRFLLPNVQPMESPRVPVPVPVPVPVAEKNGEISVKIAKTSGSNRPPHDSEASTPSSPEKSPQPVVTEEIEKEKEKEKEKEEDKDKENNNNTVPKAPVLPVVPLSVSLFDKDAKFLFATLSSGKVVFWPTGAIKGKISTSPKQPIQAVHPPLKDQLIYPSKSFVIRPGLCYAVCSTHPSLKYSGSQIHGAEDNLKNEGVLALSGIPPSIGERWLLHPSKTTLVRDLLPLYPSPWLSAQLSNGASNMLALVKSGYSSSIKIARSIENGSLQMGDSISRMMGPIWPLCPPSTEFSFFAVSSFPTSRATISKIHAASIEDGILPASSPSSLPIELELGINGGAVRKHITASPSQILLCASSNVLHFVEIPPPPSTLSRLFLTLKLPPIDASSSPSITSGEFDPSSGICVCGCSDGSVFVLRRSRKRRNLKEFQIPIMSLFDSNKKNQKNEDKDPPRERKELPQLPPKQQSPTEKSTKPSASASASASASTTPTTPSTPRLGPKLPPLPPKSNKVVDEESKEESNTEEKKKKTPTTSQPPSLPPKQVPKTTEPLIHPKGFHILCVISPPSLPSSSTSSNPESFPTACLIVSALSRVVIGYSTGDVVLLNIENEQNPSCIRVVNAGWSVPMSSLRAIDPLVELEIVEGEDDEKEWNEAALVSYKKSLAESKEALEKEKDPQESSSPSSKTASKWIEARKAHVFPNIHHTKCSMGSIALLCASSPLWNRRLTPHVIIITKRGSDPPVLISLIDGSLLSTPPTAPASTSSPFTDGGGSGSGGGGGDSSNPSSPSNCPPIPAVSSSSSSPSPSSSVLCVECIDPRMGFPISSPRSSEEGAGSGSGGIALRTRMKTRIAEIHEAMRNGGEEEIDSDEEFEEIEKNESIEGGDEGARAKELLLRALIKLLPPDLGAYSLVVVTPDRVYQSDMPPPPPPSSPTIDISKSSSCSGGSEINSTTTTPDTPRASSSTPSTISPSNSSNLILNSPTTTRKKPLPLKKGMITPQSSCIAAFPLLGICKTNGESLSAPVLCLIDSFGGVNILQLPNMGNKLLWSASLNDLRISFDMKKDSILSSYSESQQRNSQHSLSLSTKKQQKKQQKYNESGGDSGKDESRQTLFFGALKGWDDCFLMVSRNREISIVSLFGNVDPHNGHRPPSIVEFFDRARTPPPRPSGGIIKSFLGGGGSSMVEWFEQGRAEKYPSKAPHEPREYPKMETGGKIKESSSSSSTTTSTTTTRTALAPPSIPEKPHKREKTEKKKSPLKSPDTAKERKLLSLDEIAGNTQADTDAVRNTKNKLIERGEKLERFEQKTSDLANAGADFYAFAHAMAEKERIKHEKRSKKKEKDRDID